MKFIKAFKMSLEILKIDKCNSKNHKEPIIVKAFICSKCGDIIKTENFDGKEIDLVQSQKMIREESFYT